MRFALDTSIAIGLRDRDPKVISALRLLDEVPAISLITLAELEGGIYRANGEPKDRRAALDAMLAEVDVLSIERRTIDVYGEIVAALGYSRRQVFDRLIAATAIVHERTLITANGADFRDIPRLSLEVWPAQ